MSHQVEVPLIDFVRASCDRDAFNLAQSDLESAIQSALALGDETIARFCREQLIFLLNARIRWHTFGDDPVQRDYTAELLYTRSIKEAAVDAGDFERAAWLRDREMEALRLTRRLSTV